MHIINPEAACRRIIFARFGLISTNFLNEKDHHNANQADPERFSAGRGC